MANNKLISVVTPCYNEEGNVEELYRQVKQVFDKLNKYNYEHIFIDNASRDKTVSILKDIAEKDHRVKIIVNNRNFGFVRSSYYVLTHAYGDAVIFIVADLQDPPSLIAQFIEKWEEGHKVVKAIKIVSKENFLMYAIRSFYYYLVGKLSDVRLDSHFMGFGLYDKQVVDTLRAIDDPYPYLRGLISELGFKSAKINYTQSRRKIGKSSYNFYELYDVAMLGITSHSRIPLRLATFLGMIIFILSFLAGLGYLTAKLILWNRFTLGPAPIIISIFLLSSLQLFFIGLLGEYIGHIHLRSLKRPLVIEKERINF